MNLQRPLASCLLLASLTFGLAGCGSSTYMDYADTSKGFDRAEALEKKADYRAAALAYEKLAAPPKPYILDYYYRQAWSGAGKNWAAAGDDARALAAFEQGTAAARREESYTPGKWPQAIASANMELARYLSTRQPQRARELIAELMQWAEALPGADTEISNTPGGAMNGAATLLESLGDNDQALRAALLSLDKDDASMGNPNAYRVAMRLAQKCGRGDLVPALDASLRAITEVSALIESGQIAYAPWRKIGNTYTSTDYSKAQTAEFYRSCAAAYRRRGQERIALNNEQHALRYQQWANQENARSNSSAPAESGSDSPGVGAQLLGGLLQSVGTVMQQQAAPSAQNAARATLVQGMGAAIASDQQGIDRATRQSFALSAQQKAAQGDAAGALAATLAGQTYAGGQRAGAVSSSGGAATSSTGVSNGTCPDTLMYASGKTTSYRSVAAQFDAAELQDSFNRFQSCMRGGSGECYLFYRNGEPADYPLAALRGSAGDPDDMNARVFRCHAQYGFATRQ